MSINTLKPFQTIRSSQALTATKKLHHQTRLALGSDTTLTIVSSLSEASVNSIFRELWLRIFQFERQFSRFVPDSELSRFNRRAGQSVAITPSFRKILLAARRMASATANLYNPFILPALQRAGYVSSFVPRHAGESHDLYVNRYVAAIDQLVIRDSEAQIPYSTALDLGGCGKGYLADELSRLHCVGALDGYWFSFGGDVVGGGRNVDSQPWQVSIQDAHMHTSRLDAQITFDMPKFAVASSGTIIRRNDGGKSWHHIIDPRSMKPARSDILLATTVHDSALEADVMASCAVMLGSSEALSFLRQHGSRCLVLQHVDGTRTSFGIDAYANNSTGGKTPNMFDVPRGVIS